MAALIDFETAGLAMLRRRVAEVEGAHRDLIAFARGRSGAIAAVHAAALAAADAEGPDHLVHIVTQGWPDLLDVDAVAFAVILGARAWRGDTAGLHPIGHDDVRAGAARISGAVVRGAPRGHPLFGPACDLIRAEALVALDGPPPVHGGLLALGRRAPGGFEARFGTEPMLFLGAFLSRMLVRWLPR